MGLHHRKFFPVMHRDEGLVNRRSLPAGNSFETCVPCPPPPPAVLFFRAVAQGLSLRCVCLPPFILIYSTLTRSDALCRLAPPVPYSGAPMNGL